jgi:hypothetical protein
VRGLFGTLLALLALLGVGVGCAGLGSSRGEDTVSTTTGAMDQHRLEQIFADQTDAITGPSGALQTQVDGITVYCLSDPEHDRVRIIAPITRMTGLDPRVYEILLRANFHSALDARYAIADDVVFSVFLHPISSISPELIESAVPQVVNLVKTFGTSYSSGGLVFPGLDSGDANESQ